MLSMQKPSLMARDGVERPKLWEFVSCITEAVRHHAYVFLFHAVAAAAAAVPTSKASEVEGWERERPVWRCHDPWCFEGNGALGKGRKRSTVMTLLLSVLLLLNMVSPSCSGPVSG